MSTTEQPKVHETALFRAVAEQAGKHRDENQRLRVAIAECGNLVGGIVGPQCTVDFLSMVPNEVRLVVERLRNDRTEAIQDAERARDERNRSRLECAREWMQKCNEVATERDHWKANHDQRVSAARFLIERGDIPAERVSMYHELLALRAFHQFFADRCEGLFAQFGMDAVNAYNAAASTTRTTESV
ncbi:hypothetical protein AWB80_08149 [Caballeronia pedi]|uniref:Uncharacterized protein n=1 Tax=Caballeronia pedi TaxID=1777141 RepID=A0A158E414_9BURK|nr:hypothetical protein [Caballeronia pedi]SAL01544.1 hypothetical protein AWB80_08149 [Caballeronia pedi]